MSINITNTGEPMVGSEVKSSEAQLEGAPDTAGVPDVSFIAKLANEFFKAQPGMAAPNPSADQHVPPGHAYSGGGVPYLPREVFSFPRVPTPPSAPSSLVGVLNEVDFRAIAASLAGVTGLLPQSLGEADSSGLSSPTNYTDDGKRFPFGQVPVFPFANETHEFPGIPSMPAALQTGSPGIPEISAVPMSASIQPAAQIPTAVDAPEAGPWSSPPIISDAHEMYSFPRVPGASVPGAPNGLVASTAVPSGQPDSTAVSPAAPTELGLLPSQTSPAMPSYEKTIENFPADSQPEARKSFGLPTIVPSASAMFSLPGVPGAQSPPGVPVVPSSIPTKVPDEKNARDFGTAPAGVPLPQTPAIPQSLIPIPSTHKANTNPGNTELPRDTESVEFRPDVVPALETSKRPLDTRLIRQDFPILQERIHGRQLIWLDNAATTQKPNAVIDRLSAFYRHENSNIHRAAHTLAARATDAYESARDKTRRFLNASTTREIIFVRGTTEGINLVAQSWGRRNVNKDDEIVITWLEHHANIVPWQQLCAEKGARLRVAPVNDRGEIILEEYERLFTPRTRLAAFSQVSNALGTITPAREMIEIAHRHGACVLVDGAQSVAHLRADVQKLDCDFFVFSGHKIFGPTGIGVVYGKLDVLDNMPPWQGGGNMIADVTFEKTTYQASPARFEAGTGNIADAVGLGAALDYVEEIGLESIASYEHELMEYGTAGLLTVPGLRLIGTAHEKAGVMSFVLDELRTEDVGAALNQEGIAVRSGHHCAQPILRRMGVESTVRPSLAFYNTREELDALVAALLRIQAGHARP